MNADPRIPPNVPMQVTLSAAEWNTVMMGLAQLPYHVAKPLIDTLQRQCLHQWQMIEQGDA